MLNTHQPNVVSKRVNQDKKNQIKGLEFTLFFNQENFKIVLISKEPILIDKDPFLSLKSKFLSENNLNTFTRMGYTQKLLKIQDTFFHFTHKKEISIYFFIFPSFTSSDSALANDGRVTPSFCATSC